MDFADTVFTAEKENPGVSRTSYVPALTGTGILCYQ
jgi:hypothetical protein